MNLFVWFVLASHLGLCLNTAIRKSTFLGGPMMDRGYWVDRRCRAYKGVNAVPTFNRHKKLINRRRTLKERKNEPKEEERFMKALEIETMSSEDSDSEDDSIFVTRPLPWVSTEFKQLIQRLDRKYDRTLNAQGKRLKSKRTVGEPSDRQCPKKPKGLEWMFG
ncbi:unnamed protein product [Mytilus coruscus]|uniref:Uncharacterized protein n=1 Tax=Mytilus coruscus TaxID=42192 RepID=A0A6J8D0N8_MYTCO|nr:unnamed protein product [Mytilus coruscus]